MKKSTVSILIAFVAVGFILGSALPSWAVKTYTMKSGDTLWDLSQKFFGDPTLYPIFLEVNDIDNPRTIPTGREIIVPNYDEMKKIAQEPDPEKRKTLIKNVTGGVSPATTTTTTTTTSSSSSGSSSGSSVGGSSDPNNPSIPSGPIDPKDVTFGKILEGPGVSGDKIRKVNTPQESQP